MPQSFYQPGRERGEKVNELFRKIAPRYDLVNDLQSAGLHRYWKRRLTRLAAISPGERILDVGCGTGDLTFAAGHAGGKAVGIDFNREMLEVAGTKHRALRSENSSSIQIMFLRGDAQRLPFADHSFHAVTAGYLLRNLADWEMGLHEMLRVTKPGGRVLLLEFGKPSNPLWRRIYFGYLRLVVPLFGKIFHGDAGTYAYILESLQHYPAQEAVAQRMQALGFARVQVTNFFGGAMALIRGDTAPRGLEASNTDGTTPSTAQSKVQSPESKVLTR